MLSYLSYEQNRLRSYKSGMEKNPDLWTAQSVQITAVDKMITDIDATDAQVAEAEHIRSQKLAGARELSAAASKLGDQIDNLARGFHANDEAKLLDYDIKLKKPKTAKPVPSKILIPFLEDDTDGEGFIVSTQVDPNADYYEWQKGSGTNAADAKAIPELKNFKTTKKTNFVDDEVPKGVRVFYRVRAANANGTGPWSEAVSRVQ